MRIGVDLGGTNVRAGLVKDGRIVRLLSEPCKADRPEGEVVDHIASLIGKLITPTSPASASACRRSWMRRAGSSTMS